MDLILVVTDEPRHRVGIKSALSAQGWWVTDVEDRQTALRVAADQAPQLVFVDSSLPGAADLVKTFGRKNGGPGALVLAPKDRFDAAFSLYEMGADEILTLPLRAEDAVGAARRALAAPRPAAGSPSEVGRKFNAAQIFGEVLSELEEGEAPAVVDEPAVEAEPQPMAGDVARPASPAAPEPTVSEEHQEQSFAELFDLRVAVAEVAEESAVALEPPEVVTLDEVPMLDDVPTLDEAPTVDEVVAPDDVVTLDEVPMLDDVPTLDEAPTVDEVVAPDEAVRLEAEPASAPLPEIEEPGVADAASPVFGSYRLEERISAGGMAEVWKARMVGAEGFEKTVALKKILPQLTENQEFVAMFVGEAKLAARLNHPNIVHIFDLGKLDDDYVLAMEYVDGKDLRSVLNGARRRGEHIPLGLSLMIAESLAGALDYAHRSDGEDRPGLVHRDLSPRNVLLSFEGAVKLCDFGVAKARSTVEETEGRALKGKIRYMSPEQARGESADPRSDLFSLGAVLFEMVTGERLFNGEDDGDVLAAVREAKVRHPRDVVPELPEGICELLLNLLEARREDRPESAGVVQSGLAALAAASKPAPSHLALAGYLRRVFERLDPVPKPILGAAVPTRLVAPEVGDGETGSGSEPDRELFAPEAQAPVESPPEREVAPPAAPDSAPAAARQPDEPATEPAAASLPVVPPAAQLSEALVDEPATVGAVSSADDDGVQDEDPGSVSTDAAAASTAAPSTAAERPDASPARSSLLTVRVERAWIWWVAAGILLALLGLLAWQMWAEREETAPSPLPTPGGAAAVTAPSADAGGETAGGEAALDQLDIEGLVAEELDRREAELRQTFADEEQRLERRLEEIEAEAPADEEPADDPPPTG